MLEWIRDLLQLNVDLVEKGGYAGIFVLMTIESSFIPFPSEVVVPPAGYLAAQGRMSMTWILVWSIAGSLAGAYFNYWIAIRLGRPFFHRHGKWFLVSAKGIDRAEAFFARHGEIGTFVGRLIPVVRQLISLPAGMARMNLARFGFYTGLGAGIWCAVLAGIGWSIGKAGDRLDLARVKDESTRVFLVWVLPALVLLVAGYVLLRRRRGRGTPPSPGEGGVGDSGP